MITKELKDLVRDEAAKLKANATGEELNRLNLDTFWAMHSERCIYGQMTGFCRSKRAIKLLSQCAVSFSGCVDEDTWATTPPVNGFVPVKPYHVYEIAAFSPIEVYIAQPQAKNENLIAYLKGEKERLVI